MQSLQKSQNLMYVLFSLRKAVAKNGQNFSRNIEETFVQRWMGGYSRVQGGWVGQKCDESERTYCMDGL